MSTPALLALLIAGATLILFSLYLFAIAPNRRRAAAVHYASFHYAHRGLHDATVPENSLAAFEAACRAGYGIELDVHLSRDGIPVVFHDATLKRMCGVDRPLSDLTAEELGRTPLLGNAAHTVPRLAEVLALVRGRVPLLVELKGGREVSALCEACAALLDGYRGEYCIESFSPYVVRWFRRHRPLVVRGQLSDRFLARRGHRTLPMLILQLLLTNFLTRPDFISFNVCHRRSLSFRLATQLLGAQAFAWTVKTEEEMEDACGYFDCMIFEGVRPPRRTREDED